MELKKNPKHLTLEEGNPLSTDSDTTTYVPTERGSSLVKIFTEYSLDVHVIDFIQTGPTNQPVNPVDISATDPTKDEKHSVSSNMYVAPAKVNDAVPTTTTDPVYVVIHAIKDYNDTIHIILEMILYKPVTVTHIME